MGGVNVKLQTLLTLATASVCTCNDEGVVKSAFNGGQLSPSRSGRFIPRETDYERTDLRADVTLWR
jgi:hypothetical protein